LPENVLANALDPSFGALVLKSYKFHSKRIIVPNDLLIDGFGGNGRMATELGKICGARIARVQNRFFTTGAGNGQPTGVVTMATVAVTSASQTAISADDLAALQAAIPPAYREDPTACMWMVHPNTWLTVLQLKDGAGRPLFPQRLPGQPVLLNSFVVLNSHMPQIAAAAVPVLYGRFDKFVIRDVNQMQLQIFSEASGLIDADRSTVAAVLRSDGALIDAGTHPIQAYAMHS
jgi:HK97 family phage major capsid protein